MDPSSLPFGNIWIQKLVKFIKTWTLRKWIRSNEKSRTDMNTSNYARFTAFPEEGKVDPEACSFPFIGSTPTLASDHMSFPATRSDKTAIDRLKPGDATIIFTPDSERGCET